MVPTPDIAPIGGKRRKAPQERREEIVRVASAMALANGLDSLTLRNVAAELGVASSLIGHYFPVVDDLIAEAFVHTASGEMQDIFGAMANEPSPLSKVKTMLAMVLREDRDPLSLFWLDAWHSSRRRPKLLTEVAEQMRIWEAHLADLIRNGSEAGIFRVDDPMVASMYILALIDGLSFQAAMRPAASYGQVGVLMIRNAERELGLRRGKLESLLKLTE